MIYSLYIIWYIACGKTFYLLEHEGWCVHMYIYICIFFHGCTLSRISSVGLLYFYQHLCRTPVFFLAVLLYLASSAASVNWDQGCAQSDFPYVERSAFIMHNYDFFFPTALHNVLPVCRCWVNQLSCYKAIFFVCFLETALCNQVSRASGHALMVERYLETVWNGLVKLLY